jgi:hypothetical protein
MNEVSIIINGVRYDAVETESTGCKKKDCDLFKYCYQGYENPRVCKLASKNITFKKSTKSFER